MANMLVSNHAIVRVDLSGASLRLCPQRNRGHTFVSRSRHWIGRREGACNFTSILNVHRVATARRCDTRDNDRVRRVRNIR